MKNTKFYLLLVTQFITLAVLFIALLFPFQKKNPGLEIIRETANKLHAAGVIHEAILQYEKYLDSSNNNPSQQAGIAFSLAELYESEGNLEKALGWYYRVEGYDSKSKYKEQSAKKIVAILEKTGKTSAAKMAMEKRVSLEKKDQANEKAVLIAQVADKKIYDYELNQALDLLPPDQQKQFNTTEGKLNLTRKLIADELLFRKASRLGLEHDDRYLKQIAQMQKELMVRLVVNDEISQKIKNDENEIQNYYKNNSDQFKNPDSYTILTASFLNEKDALQVINKMKKGLSLKKISSKSQELHITQGETLKGFTPDITLKAISSNEGNIHAPIFFDNKFHVFQNIKTATGTTIPYDQVKEYVARAYQMSEAKKLYEDMMTNLLKNEDIKIYQENIK